MIDLIIIGVIAATVVVVLLIVRHFTCKHLYIGGCHQTDCDRRRYHRRD